MSKISRNSRYFADDKDIFDLVSQGSVPVSRLAEILRRRGVVVSPDIDKGILAHDFQRLQFSWPQLVDLLEILDRPERDDKFSSFRMEADPGVLSVDAVVNAAATLKSTRGDKLGETYKVTRTNDDSVSITVEYYDRDPSKTRLRQGTDKTLSLTIDKTDFGLQIRHSASPRATEVIGDLEKLLAAEGKPPPKKREINLSALGSASRTRFFVELARGITGYRLVDQSGLRVDRPIQDDADKAAENEEDVADAGKVNRATLHGNGLLSSSEYRTYKEKGFSVTKLDWVAEAEDSSLGRVEFMAEFQHGPEGNGFKFGVLGKWDRKEDGELVKTRKSVTVIEKIKFLQLIEDAAYRALDSASQSLGQL